MRRNLRPLTSIIAAALLAMGAPALAHTDRDRPQVWFAPQGLDPTRQGAVDFAALFQPDAPWRRAAAHTQVFKFYSGWLLHAPQAEINAEVADLNRRGIAIAVETGVMNVAPNPPSGCGGLGNVEGYGTVPRAKRIAEIIEAAHGKISYIAMDEPLFYGHVYTHFAGKGQGCHSPVAEVLRLTKPTLDTFIQEFPDVVIGDVEPTVFAGTDPAWQGDLEAWVTGFRATMGRPLAFLDLDVEWWRGPAEADALYHQADSLKDRGLIGQLGVIYNGTPQDQSDAAWVQDAERHIQLVEDQLHWRPDQAIIQSWTPRPSHALPETAPDTLTHLIDAYVDHSRRDH